MSKSVEEHVLKQFKLIQLMGSGAYGHVWKVEAKIHKKIYALKKVFDAFRNSIDAQRTYREVEVLNQLDHHNIVQLKRVIKSKNKKDLYLLFQFMEADLHSVVGTNILQKNHQIYIFFQILKGLKYLHSAQLIHRDLKPSNILLDSDCNSKLCDFGLVRSLASEDNEQVILSEEVATKWYRAPQLLLGSRNYKKPVDLWSVGCIAAELLIGRPLFAGNSTLNQLQKIIQFTGFLRKEDIQALESPIADSLVGQIKIKHKQFREYFSSVEPAFYELLNGLLCFNPNKRLTVDEALHLQLFQQFTGEIKHLPICEHPIIPMVNDNVRFQLKVYRDKIYEGIDQKQINLHKLSHIAQSISPKENHLPSPKQHKVKSNPKIITEKFKNIHHKENLKPKVNSRKDHQHFSLVHIYGGGKQEKSIKAQPNSSNHFIKKRHYSTGNIAKREQNSMEKTIFSPKNTAMSPCKILNNLIVNNFQKKSKEEGRLVKKRRMNRTEVGGKVVSSYLQVRDKRKHAY